ncbi:MAG TPA: HAD hydrolase family protein [Bacteroidales bacterium]|jgi:hydroxymethylpyrimidine pyrophosphatase-like HAD family hydrolase|nr:HAD hydrolase family protein [Bacteroidales bacterium]HOU99117.1 HAD hydrolase family protein [Bacteroidales bacterium]
MKIAVDFDGTIVENKYPEIGEEKLFAFETLKQLQKRGHQIILWTYRTGRELDEAVNFCKAHGVEFYAVNNNYPEEKPSDGLPRKINADIYIDDRNLGGFIEWGKVWQILTDESMEALESQYNKSKKSFFLKLFKK